MTTQPSSPFQGSVENQSKEDSVDFSFRTMQDDLSELEKAGQGKMEIKTEKTVSEKIESTPSQQKPFDLKDMVSEEVSPFAPQQASPKKQSTEERPIQPTNLSPQIQQALERKPDLVEVPAVLKEKVPTENNGSNIVKAIIFIIIFLIVGVMGFGGYYFWTNNRASKQVPQEEQLVEEMVPPAEEPVEVVVPVEKYTSEKANALTINLNTMSGAEIQATLSSAAAEIKNLSVQTPYEFIIVDDNNNPVTFPVFATAAKINLSPELLSALGEDFSLFIYNDSGNMRLGLSITVAKEDALAIALAKQELTFATDASFLFLDSIPDITIGSFGSSNYKEVPIRYLNLNQQNNLSIDYAVFNSQLVIGTSKNIQRTILDRLLQQKATEATVTVPTENQTSIETATEQTPISEQE